MSSSPKERLLRKLAAGFMDNQDLLADPGWRHREQVTAVMAKDLRAGIALAIDLAIAMAPIFKADERGMVVESECCKCHTLTAHVVHRNGMVTSGPVVKRA